MVYFQYVRASVTLSIALLESGENIDSNLTTTT
jgi:hypothetical protein